MNSNAVVHTLWRVNPRAVHNRSCDSLGGRETPGEVLEQHMWRVMCARRRRKKTTLFCQPLSPQAKEKMTLYYSVSIFQFTEIYFVRIKFRHHRQTFFKKISKISSQYMSKSPDKLLQPPKVNLEVQVQIRIGVFTLHLFQAMFKSPDKIASGSWGLQIK